MCGRLNWKSLIKNKISIGCRIWEYGMDIVVVIRPCWRLPLTKHNPTVIIQSQAATRIFISPGRINETNYARIRPLTFWQ